MDEVIAEPHTARREAFIAQNERMASSAQAAAWRGSTAPTPQKKLTALCVFDLAQREFPKRESLLSPWLNSQDLSMVFAERGIGKTHFSVAVAFAVSTGGRFLDWTAPAPAKVLYLDGELPGEVMQQRLAMHAPDVDPAPGYLRVFTPGLLADDDLMPDLATIDGQKAVEALIEVDTRLVIVDNLSAWARSGGRENDAESWLCIADWLMALRRRGIAVIIVHHGGKNGGQRGTSKREDLLDASIKLSRPADYDPREGAKFLMSFSKSRHLTGDDVQSLEITLNDIDGRAKWTWSTTEDSTFDRVVALQRDGLRPSDIVAELDINKSSVSRHLKRARELGLISGDAEK
jgi:DNA-binding transcriptional ArsR family regulator